MTHKGWCVVKHQKNKQDHNTDSLMLYSVQLKEHVQLSE